MDTKLQNIVLEHYRFHGRELPWRDSHDPYGVLVSEYMLQQTQVPRAAKKYPEFMVQFPSLKALADASFSSVLRVWSGLGYNRRAKYLHQTAKTLISEYRGSVPPDVAQLESLPGIGSNTAGAIIVYAYNRPEVFIETNIRTVYLHHYFEGRKAVNDTEILPLVARTLDTDNPRVWYWALMDYGSHLKRVIPNPNRRSRHYAQQSAFPGSKRQLRGNVLKRLGREPASVLQLRQEYVDERLPDVLAALTKEGFIVKADKQYRLAD